MSADLPPAVFAAVGLRLIPNEEGAPGRDTPAGGETVNRSAPRTTEAVQLSMVLTSPRLRTCTRWLRESLSPCLVMNRTPSGASDMKVPPARTNSDTGTSNATIG